MGWPMPESSNAWWLDEPNHPDAASHKAFLEEHMVKEDARVGRPLPPRRRKSTTRTTASDFELFGKCMRDALAPLQKRIEELESRPFKFVGVWTQGMELVPGNICSYAGSMWHCNEATKDKPGTSAAFVLCVKRGRDGRDGKDAAK
jgi:hypothetical protein